jgi:NaMN:DMB phosphoribosyltransferase
VYFGEMEGGSTTTAKGRGIKIFSTKEVQVGHYENNKKNGQARVVRMLVELISRGTQRQSKEW